MAKNNTNIFVGILVFAIIIFFFLGNSAGLFSSVGGTVTRDAPNIIKGGNSFTLFYTASGTGAYGVSIVDTISGGCTFDGGETTYRGVILSDDNKETVRINTPTTATTCRIQGDYKFGAQSIIGMPDITIKVIEDTCKIDDDCLNGEICVKGLCISEDDVEEGAIIGGIDDTALNRFAINVLGLDESSENLKLYITLFYVGALLLVFLIFRLIMTTPK